MVSLEMEDEMNEAMQMLKDLMERLGMTARDAWPMVVANVYFRALFAIIATTLVSMVFCVCVVIGVKKYRHELSLPRNLVAYNSADARVFWLGFAIVALLGALLVLSLGWGIRGPDLFAPEGATIRMITGK